MACCHTLTVAAAAQLPRDEHDPEDEDSFATSIQTWFADDGTLLGRIFRLRMMWDTLCAVGPPLGYFPNGKKKTVLVVKTGQEERARKIFDRTDVKITTEGYRHLGAAIGSPASNTSTRRRANGSARSRP